MVGSFNCVLLSEKKKKKKKRKKKKEHQTDKATRLSIGIIQARILEWVARPPSRGSSQPRDRTQVSSPAVRFLTS